MINILEQLINSKESDNIEEIIKSCLNNLIIYKCNSLFSLYITLLSLNNYSGLIVIDSLFPFISWKNQENLYHLVILQFNKLIKNTCSIIATKPSIFIFINSII